MAVEGKRQGPWGVGPLLGEERFRTEEALHRAEERLRLALAAAKLETWEWDVPSATLEYSPGLRALFDLPPDLERPSYAALLQRVHPADRARIRATLRASIHAGAEANLQFRVPGANGSVRWLDAHARSVRDATGRPTRLLGTLLDITERKERERDASRLARSEKLLAIGQMASGVAHDLSQSLALIAGYTDLAREMAKRLGADAPQLIEAIEIAAQAATDAGESVTRLLEFSRSQPPGRRSPSTSGRSSATSPA